MPIDLTQFQKKEKLDLSQFQKKPMSFGQRYKQNFLNNISEGGQAAIGVLKGVASTVSGASELGQRGLRAITPSFGREREITKLPEKYTTPVGTGQKIGFGVEQIGEFFVPGGQALKAQKAITKAAQAVPKAKGLLALLGRAGVEAGVFGGVTALQKGKIDKEVAESAAVGAAFPIAGEAIKPLKDILGKKMPSRFINNIIRPVTKEFKFGKNPGLAVAQENIKANSIEELAKGITGKKRQLGQMIGDQVKKSSVLSNAQGIVNDVLQKHVPKVTDQNAINQMNNVLNQILNVTKVEGGKVVPIGRKNLIKMTSEDLHKLQQKVGELAVWTGNPAEKPVNAMLSDLYGRLGKLLDKASPGTKSLQRRFANLLGAEKAIQNRIAVDVRNNLIGLRQAGVGGLVTAGQLARGEDPIEAAVYGGLTALGLGILKSPAVTTRAASALSEIGKAKATGTTAQRIFGAAKKEKPMTRALTIR